MSTSKRYPPEVRERAVRLVFEQEPDHESQWAALRSIAERSGMTAETLRKWVRQAERDAGRRPGLSTAERDRLRDLEKENKELRRANEILKAASAFFGRGSIADAVMVDFIDDNKVRWGVEPICRVLPIAPSTYYAFKKRPPSERAPRDEYLRVHIERVYRANFSVYGAPRCDASSTAKASRSPGARWRA